MKGITFVGSTSVGKHIYATAAASANGSRPLHLRDQNHALVLEDAPVERTRGRSSTRPSAARASACMALPVVVVRRVSRTPWWSPSWSRRKDHRGTDLQKTTAIWDPVVNMGHKKSVLAWIEKGTWRRA